MIHEESTMSAGRAAPLLLLFFLLIVSLWTLPLKELLSGEGYYAAEVHSIHGFPPMLTLHGMFADGGFPLYQLLAKGLLRTGIGMEMALRLVPVISLSGLCGIVFLLCFRAMGAQAAAAGAAALFSSLLVIEKFSEGTPLLLCSLGLFSAWMLWFDLGVWRGKWRWAWLFFGWIAGLTFYTMGWSALLMLTLPMFCLRRPLAVWSKPRGFGFAAGLLILCGFVILWGFPRWRSGTLAEISRTYTELPSIGDYLLHLLTFPAEVFLRFLPWSLFMWAPFCPAIVPLDKNPVLMKYLRTLLITLFCMLWISPFCRGRNLLLLAPFIGALTGLSYWIVVRRYGGFFLKLFRCSGGVSLLFSLGALLFTVLPSAFLNKFPGLDVDLAYRGEPFVRNLGILLPAGGVLLSLAVLVFCTRNSKVWLFGLLAVTAYVLPFHGVIMPYRAADHPRRDFGKQIAQALGNDAENINLYKSQDLPDLFSECHYSGAGSVAAVKDIRDIPESENTVYLLSGEVPSLPERAWTRLLSREYKKQRIYLWKGELRTDENYEQ